MSDQLKYDPEACAACETIDCLVRCPFMEFTREEARRDRELIIEGKPSRVLADCATCYACEEFCPSDNHPFYLLVDRQEQLKIEPAPLPITRQQILMMEPRGQIAVQKLAAPLINMCFFPMLTGTITGKLYAGASTIVGSDIFCNIMWLHFARNSVIRERLPRVIDNLMNFYLEPNGLEEMVCYHDECYGTYTHLAPAFGIEVPFKVVHLYQHLAERLSALKDQIKPLKVKVAYQRPCSNRLIPETQHWVDDIFQLIGADRVERTYDRENALCCAALLRAHQRDELADELQEKNLEDMQSAGAKFAVFNCPMCFFTLRKPVAERGMTPILMSDLCRMALGESMWG